MTLSEVIKAAVNAPNYLWADNKRQAIKLRKRLSVLSDVYGLEKSSIAEVILGVASARLSKESQTIYFPNIGSSGSHLMQEAINRSWFTIPLGEVYIPPKIVPIINKLEKKDQNCFMESWHLLHSMSFYNLFNLDALIVNTAHNANLGRFSKWTRVYDSCLIIRNPVDIVLSRTFRKDDYRSYISPGIDDQAYLDKNIKLVERFYTLALNYGYKNIVKFEDIFNNPESVSDVVYRLIGCPQQLLSFEKSLHDAISDGKSTNLYSGKEKVIPRDLKRQAITRLSALTSAMSYS